MFSIGSFYYNACFNCAPYSFNCRDVDWNNCSDCSFGRKGQFHYSRQIQNALLEVDEGVIEAAESMGSSPIEIIFRVYLKKDSFYYRVSS